MDAAAAGLFGTAIGATATGLFAAINARGERQSRIAEEDGRRRFERDAAVQDWQRDAFHREAAALLQAVASFSHHANIANAQIGGAPDHSESTTSAVDAFGEVMNFGSRLMALAPDQIGETIYAIQQAEITVLNLLRHNRQFTAEPTGIEAWEKLRGLRRSLAREIREVLSPARSASAVPDEGTTRVSARAPLPTTAQ